MSLPEWIIGENVEGGRFFTHHTSKPEFIAEVFDELTSGLAFALTNGQYLGNLVFYDHAPTGDDFIRWMTAAGQALDDYDLQVHADQNRVDEYDEDDDDEA